MNANKFWLAKEHAAADGERAGRHVDFHAALVGGVSANSPDDFVISFDAEKQTVTADMALNAEFGGGAKIRFGDAALGGTSTFTDDQNYSATAKKDSITVFLEDGVVTVLHSGDANLQSGGTEEFVKVAIS